MLPNEVFALECLARYAREGLDVKEGGVHDGHKDEFAHCPIPRPKGQKKRLPGDLGYYLTFFDHQHQGLLQSVDEGRMCYYNPKVRKYLDTMPPGYAELIVIYNKFNKRTEESKKRIGEANSGKTRTEDQNKAHSEQMSGRFMGALNHGSKAIIAIKPDGTELHFGGVCEAARELKIPDSSLSRYLITGKSPTRGNCQGYKFFYAVKE